MPFVQGKLTGHPLFDLGTCKPGPRATVGTIPTQAGKTGNFAFRTSRRLDQMIDRETLTQKSQSPGVLCCKKISQVSTAASSGTGIEQCHGRQCHGEQLFGEKESEKGKLMVVQRWASVHFLKGFLTPHGRWMMPQADLLPRPGFHAHLQLVHGEL